MDLRRRTAAFKAIENTPTATITSAAEPVRCRCAPGGPTGSPRRSTGLFHVMGEAHCLCLPVMVGRASAAYRRRAAIDQPPDHIG
jgi:hypothetical protein